MDLYHHYFHFPRHVWQEGKINEAPILTAEELEDIRGLNDRVSLRDISEIYFPLIKWIALYYHEKRMFHRQKMTFLQKKEPMPPFMIALTGSVAVGKSTMARIFKLMLERFFASSRRVELVTTDGFLYSNKELIARGLMNKKGFPESYNKQKWIQFLTDVKTNKNEIEVPLYSHFAYDVLSETRVISRPDIVIMEGINVLQSDQENSFYPNDFFDFSVYMDADEEDIKRWYLERFFMLRETAFQDETAYFHKYTKVPEEDACRFALKTWETVNGANLKENIEQTKYRAHLILRKDTNHLISDLYLRR